MSQILSVLSFQLIVGSPMPFEGEGCNKCHLAVCCSLPGDWLKSCEKVVGVWGEVSALLWKKTEAINSLGCEWVYCQ